MVEKTIAIVGAGIIGITTAYLLKRAGYRVILIDAEDGPALKTSYANGCQLSYSYIDAMSSPSLIKKMPKIMAGMDPAFRIKFSPDPSLVSWGSKFLLNGQAHKEEFNTQTLLRLSLHSRDVLRSVLADSNVEFEHRVSGKLLIYTNQEDLDKAAKRVRQKDEWGCKQEILSQKQCLDLEPSLRQLSQPIVGGIYSAIDEVGNPHRLSNELLKIMKQEQGFEARFNCRVNRFVKNGQSIQYLETSDGVIHADAYVLATGPESLNLVKEIGLKLPIYPIKGYSITVPATEFAPEICVTDVDNKVVVSRVGDKLRIAGCADIVGYKSHIDESRIEHLLNVCKNNFPKAGDYSDIKHTWAGIRPVTPSSVPIIGKAGVDNLFFNIGHGTLGWTLALGSASLLTAIINQQETPIDTIGMRPVDHGIC
ncbi:D-amino acid dehydrogenase [Vibrio sp. 404]|uniref:D-amino acid dehydrogenase n=1 Tax=Vibrio marinisediminis TaxID=2758441 RepID=A0A7W2FNS5_9VIBR|nr:D-amino acid dehydrogenase [Vibrio marinisediminis]MBA5761465.1 D-amino acid dehydrogenase [Vibrio marinisediminis]